MLNTNHSNPFGAETTINDTHHERGRTLEELILDLLEGEFSGAMGSHVRGEVYGGR
ncbi:hypothetical protein QA600_00275 [Natronococcus sp. A-GB1]|uniref:hypothetical protein n=1 Tax=Natronococcus sp. A-GB1 TaxID=3037648 RepID=UPI00241DD62F|nr:hypothetical protein [Natronococcus sp. A-GB1]MDG5757779.1 hypothetical protein [Natronococcus sp. A-GB1]